MDETSNEYLARNADHLCTVIQGDNSKIAWSGPSKQQYDVLKFKLILDGVLVGLGDFIWHEYVFKHLNFFDIYNLRFLSREFNWLVSCYKRYTRNCNLAKKDC